MVTFVGYCMRRVTRATSGAGNHLYRNLGGRQLHERAYFVTVHSAVRIIYVHFPVVWHASVTLFNTIIIV